MGWGFHFYGINLNSFIFFYPLQVLSIKPWQEVFGEESKTSTRRHHYCASNWSFSIRSLNNALFFISGTARAGPLLLLWVLLPCLPFYSPVVTLSKLCNRWPLIFTLVRLVVVLSWQLHSGRRPRYPNPFPDSVFLASFDPLFSTGVFQAIIQSHKHETVLPILILAWRKETSLTWAIWKLLQKSLSLLPMVNPRHALSRSKIRLYKS